LPISPQRQKVNKRPKIYRNKISLAAENNMFNPEPILDFKENKQ